MRGGHRSSKKIAIEDIDGPAQSVRQQLSAGDLEKRSMLDAKGAASGGVLPLILM